MKEFAREAGIADNTVRKYLAAWEWAAHTGLRLKRATRLTDVTWVTLQVFVTSQHHRAY